MGIIGCRNIRKGPNMFTSMTLLVPRKDMAQWQDVVGQVDGWMILKVFSKLNDSLILLYVPWCRKTAKRPLRLWGFSVSRESETAHVCAYSEDNNPPSRMHGQSLLYWYDWQMLYAGIWVSPNALILSEYFGPLNYLPSGYQDTCSYLFWIL